MLLNMYGVKYLVGGLEHFYFFLIYWEDHPN